MNKPYSESCDQNKEPILTVIKPLFSSVSSVLEIGSGTGQHAIYFCEQMPHLTWHTSDRISYMDGIKSWLVDADLNNTRPPFELDVSKSDWPEIKADAVFTANSVHIMSQRDVFNLLTGIGKILLDNGSFVVYGPFNYNQQFTSDSNRRFDLWLKDRDTASGIKDFESFVSLAKNNGLRLVKDYEMPENNRILHFIKI